MLHCSSFFPVIFMLMFSVIIGSSFARSPVIFLDGNPQTEEISPPPASVIPGETIIIAVTVQDVENLHSYSVKCLFDSQVVKFIGGAARLSPMTPAFLENRKGNIAAFIAVPGEGVVEIAATQAGSDQSKCAAGNGVLGYLSFTAKTKGNPGIKISEVSLVGPDAKRITAEIN